MAKPGEDLERLVRVVEEALAGSDFKVTSNDKVYHDGVQMAEFDIEIKGKAGSVDVRILIECRDRPSEGSAPGSWIEQLAGRKKRFKFDRVIAVSTTGFAPGVQEFAAQERIELREVESLSPEDVLSWFRSTTFQNVQYHVELTNILVGYSPDTSSELKEAGLKMMASCTPHSKVFVSTVDHVKSSLLDIWKNLMRQKQNTLIESNGGTMPPEFKIEARLRPPDDCYQLSTDKGIVNVAGIRFTGTAEERVHHVPIHTIRRYSSSSRDKPISETLTFDVPAENQTIEIDLHRIPQGDHDLLAISARRKE